jgi:hypothetical protein
MVVGSTGISLDLLNLEALTTRTSSAQSTSERLRAMASPTRMPVALSSPIMVRKVAARRGVGMTRGTAAIKASTSADE